MDFIISNLVKSFKQNQGFPDNIDDSTLFEHFVNYCVISKEYADAFEAEDVHVGGGNDLQLDGVAIIVNGSLVNTIEEIDDLERFNKYIEAEFIFIQAKSGKNFEGSKISDMFYGVRQLFSLTPPSPKNDPLLEKEKLIQHIYSKTSIFRRGIPRLKLYYVTTGNWQNDDNLKARIDTEILTLKESNYFREDPEFEIVDAKRLQKLFNQAQNTISKTITFSNRVTLPPIKGVKESYLGYLPVKTYLTLITDDNGYLLRGLFYDNVRDFQGDNPVNEEIKQTVTSQEKENFILLNNGVTVVAESLIITADNFNLTGFQIVNGCQTSHVLFNNRATLLDNVHIPIKLIVSPDDVLKNQITKATNRQTGVKLEELFALTDFQKNLEQYYNAIQGTHRLYYERRSQQYSSFLNLESSPEKIRIITISNQIRAFASMFLNGGAHRASRYYGSLLKDFENTIFVSGHFPIAYYVSAYALFRIDSFLRKKQIEAKYRPFRYHLLGILRMQITGTSLHQMTSNQFKKQCEDIQTELWDEVKIASRLNQACQVLDRILNGNYDRDRAKNSTIQEQAKTIIQEQQNISSN
jgi:hypothetical protein